MTPEDLAKKIDRVFYLLLLLAGGGLGAFWMLWFRIDDVARLVRTLSAP